jgi:hypothetical protein
MIQVLYGWCGMTTASFFFPFALTCMTVSVLVSCKKSMATLTCFLYIVFISPYCSAKRYDASIQEGIGPNNPPYLYEHSKCNNCSIQSRFIQIHIDSKASEKVTAAITNTCLCNNITKLSTHYQTSTLEAFHSLIIQFAPKLTAFSYNGMLARYILYYCLI